MATTDTVLSIPAQDFFPENAGNPTGGEFGLFGSGLIKALSFAPGQNSGAVAIKRLPANASLATGLSFKLLVADSPNSNGGVSKTTKWGVNCGIVGTTGVYYPTDLTVLGTENTGTVVMASTLGQTRELSVPIVVANAGGAAASNWVLIRVRRLGADALDTDKGPVLLIGVAVLDT